MIEIKDLRISFEQGEVLHGLSGIFREGLCNLIIGRSGSGKTVLMNCIVGLLTPDSGEIFYDGRSFGAMTGREQRLLRREMGMLFQGSALFDSMSVEDNVAFPLDMFSSLSYKDRRRRAHECLDRVGLNGSADKMPEELSGGMKKRAAIARAIALNPRYLFCDEPNSGLDPQTSLLIDELLHSLTHEHNMTTLINTHDMNSVMGIGENIIYINQGNKAWEGRSSDIMEHGNQDLNDFIFASDTARQMRALLEHHAAELKH